MRTLYTVLIVFFFSNVILSQNNVSPSLGSQLAQIQLDAYNAKDIEAFLKPYSDSVKVYNYPRTLLYEGKEVMRHSYEGWFNQAKDLHCTLVDRIDMGSTVIDYESVLTIKGKEPFEAVAIYKIGDGLIQEVTFIKKDKIQ